MAKPDDISDFAWGRAWALLAQTKYDEVVARGGSVTELNDAADHDCALIAREVDEAIRETEIAQLLSVLNKAEGIGMNSDREALVARVARAIAFAEGSDYEEDRREFDGYARAAIAELFETRKL